MRSINQADQRERQIAQTGGIVGASAAVIEPVVVTGYSNPMQARSGFGLLEVMVAMTLLAIALSTLGSSIFSLNRGNNMVLENRRAVEVAQKVLERVQSEPWKSLGRSPATWNRRETPVPGVTQYVDELPNIDAENDFMHRPLIDEPVGIDLYKYLQYGDVDFNHISTDIGEHASSDVAIQDFKRDLFQLPYVMDEQMAEWNGIDGLAKGPERQFSSDIKTRVEVKYNTPLRYNWLQFLGLMDKRSGLNNLKVYVEFYNMSASTSTNRTDFELALEDTENMLPQSHLKLDLDADTAALNEAVIVRVMVTWDRSGGGDGRHILVVARRK